MKETLKWVSLGLQMLGAVIATICYIPGAHKVTKSNDTRSISKPMFILTSCGCVLWIAIGILNLVAFWNKDDPSTLAAGLGTIVSNVGLLTCGMIIFIYKLRNSILASKLGWSEDKYYRTIGKHKNWWARYVRERAKQKDKKKSAQ